MTYSKLFFLFNAALACTLAGCGSDDSGDSDDDGASGGSSGTTSTTGTSSGGAGGSGGSTDGGGTTNSGTTDSGGSGGTTAGGTTGSTTGSGGANACNPMAGGGSGNDECTALGECIQEECESEYAECLGPNGANGDFSGGVCEDYMECASDCADGDECDFTCVAGCLTDGEACQTCLEAANECGEQACPDEYEECNASPTSTTSTTGGTTGGVEGTCMDFEECCNSLEGEDKTGCLDTLEQVAEGGDEACAILLTVYQTGGQCPS